ncbi:MAG: sugar-binding protein, partial [Ginsengibacter sp.]
MRVTKKIVKQLTILAVYLFVSQPLFAHNGTVGYAYPLGKITVDGDFSDWPQQTIRYPIALQGTDTKPQSESDYSGFFQMGYRLDNHSLYIAVTITDDDFMEDTTENVKWNTQDGLELYLDARHLPFGSGVASFMYSKKLRNTNNAYYDPFAKAASWNIVEIAMVHKGNTRYYEWRINLGNELAPGKSIGLDFFAFDRDTDGSFSFASWGRGEMKYINPRSLSDVLIMPANDTLATLSGKVDWDKSLKVQFPDHIRVTDVQDQKRWLQIVLDSLGNYSVDVPPGKYNIMLPEEYLKSDTKLYIATQKKPVIVSVKAL